MADTRTIAIGACGVSAGIQRRSSQSHPRAPVVSAGFLTASLLLALTALVLALRSELPLGPAAAVAVFAGLLAAYPLFRHTRPWTFSPLPPSSSKRSGLGVSLRLLRVDAPTPVPGLSAVFLLCLALGLMLGGGHHAGGA